MATKKTTYRNPAPIYVTEEDLNTQPPAWILRMTELMQERGWHVLYGRGPKARDAEDFPTEAFKADWDSALLELTGGNTTEARLLALFRAWRGLAQLTPPEREAANALLAECLKGERQTDGPDVTEAERERAFLAAFGELVRERAAENNASDSGAI